MTPIYEYSCVSCEDFRVVLKPMQDAEKDETCPDCGGTLERIFTSPSVKVKGGTPKHFVRGKS